MTEGASSNAATAVVSSKAIPTATSLEQKSTNALGFLVCGGVAGAVSRTIASPFERLKILFQVQDLATADAKGGPKYTGIIQALIRMGKEEGWRGYFKGNGTNVVRIIPYSAVQYLSYEKFKALLTPLSPNNELNTYTRLTAGALAGMASVFASYPLDLVRCRLSAQGTNIKYTGITNALTVIYREEGVRGLFRGLNPTLCGIAPYVALNFTTYEFLKKHAYAWQGGDPPIWLRLGLGAVAGTFAQTMAYPLDVVRRRMQMQGFAGHEHEYNGMMDAFVKIVRKDGVKGLYKGLIPNYLKVVPVVSVSFVVYEKCKEVMGLQGGGKEI